MTQKLQFVNAKNNIRTKKINIFSNLPGVSGSPDFLPGRSPNHLGNLAEIIKIQKLEKRDENEIPNFNISL
jgi:hypothetical protein